MWSWPWDIHEVQKGDYVRKNMEGYKVTRIVDDPEYKGNELVTIKQVGWRDKMKGKVIPGGLSDTDRMKKRRV